MEKIFKDAGIGVSVKPKRIILSGDTGQFRAEFTNLGGRELRSGNWSFPKDMESALVEVVLESERKDLRLDAENMSTPEVLAVCKAENLAIDTDNRDACVKGADEAKPYIDPDEISLQIRKELEKVLDLNRADPKIIYDVVAAYFGRDIAPLYQTYLPLYQAELETLKEFLDVPLVELAFLHTYEDEELLDVCSNLGLTFEGGDIESCKAALLSGESPLGRELRENIQAILSGYEKVEDISIPAVMKEVEKIYGEDLVEGNKSFLVDVVDEEIQIFAEEGPPKVVGLTLPEPPKKKRVVKAKAKPKRRKPKDPLKLNKATRKLFDDIRDGVLAKALGEREEGDPQFYGGVADLMKKQKTEDDKTYNIRKRITEKIERAELGLSPDKVVLLGYLFTKKMLYGVTYDNYVEIELQEVRERI